VQARGLFILSFALVHDVSLCYVLGLSTLLSVEVAINLISQELSCMELDRKIPLTLDLPSKGLPNGTTLNKYSPFISPCVLINITSNASLLRYTSLDCTPIPL